MPKGEEQEREPSAIQREWENIAKSCVKTLADRCKVDLVRCDAADVPALIEGLRMAFGLQVSALKFDEIVEAGPNEDD